MPEAISHTAEISWFSEFKTLTKHRLSLSVVFSSLAGYFLGATSVDFIALGLLFFGGYAMVGASNAFNQIIEKDLDVLMKRTQNRPLPSGRMSVQYAYIVATSLTILGLSLLYFINPITAFFGGVSIFIYVAIYTPLKTKTPLSVFVGAFPGAIPFMLGWVATSGNFGIEPGTLFMIQFFWQFPHFWALGWWLYDDYKSGGFFMLPTGRRDTGTAVQIILYTVWTIAVSVIPFFGITGALYLSLPSAIVILMLGMVMLFFALKLFRNRDTKSAKQLMLASVSYITLIQIVYVIDKIWRVWL